MISKGLQQNAEKPLSDTLIKRVRGAGADARARWEGKETPWLLLQYRQAISTFEKDSVRVNGLLMDGKGHIRGHPPPKGTVKTFPLRNPLLCNRGI